MKPERSVGAIFAGLILGLVLVVFSAWAIAYVTVLSPSFAKSTLESSGVYDDFAGKSVQILAADAQGTDSATAIEALTPPFEQVLTPALLRSTTESVVDGLYAWMQGKTALPVFFVDTGATRSDLNQVVVDRVNTWVAALPVCPVGTDYTAYDPFTAGCGPPGGLNQPALLEWTDSLTAEIPLLGRPNLSDADIVAASDDLVWSLVPGLYWWGKVGLGVFAGLLALIAVLVLAVGGRRSQTLRTIGHSCVTPAALLLVGGAVLALFLGTVNFQPVQTDTQVQLDFARETVLPVLQSLFRGVGVWMLIFGAGFAVLAAASYVTAHLLDKRQTAGGAGPGGQMPGGPVSGGPMGGGPVPSGPTSPGAAGGWVNGPTGRPS